jgi:hypothetical protein
MGDLEFGRPRRPYVPNPQHFVWDEIVHEWVATSGWSYSDGWTIQHVAYNSMHRRTTIIERSTRGHIAIWDLRGQWELDVERGLIEILGEETI